jgi:flagellar biogenesis protein FliO
MDSLLLTKTLAILASVLGLLYLGFIVVKKRTFFKYGGSEQRIKMKSFCRVDQKTSLALIEVDKCEFLLASNGMAISLKKLPRVAE